MTRVVVHVDRLVLKGFRHEDRYAIAQGMRRELVRLLAEPNAARGLASLPSDVRVVGSAPVRLAGGIVPDRLGTRVAGEIVRRFGS